jgi:cytochrome b6-f complex iron-sulfur subunit
MPDMVNKMDDPMVPPAAEAEAEYDPISRRTFIQVGIAAVGACYAAAIGYPVYRYLATPATRAAAASAVTSVSLPGAHELAPGTAMMFKFGTRPTLLIHHADGTWVCLDAVCTHLGCTVQFEPENQRIFCACHSGQYDWKTGEPTGGPPPRALRSYNVEVTNGEVVVSRA